MFNIIKCIFIQFFSNKEKRTKTAIKNHRKPYFTCYSKTQHVHSCKYFTVFLISFIKTTQRLSLANSQVFSKLRLSTTDNEVFTQIVKTLFDWSVDPHWSTGTKENDRSCVRNGKFEWIFWNAIDFLKCYITPDFSPNQIHVYERREVFTF